MSTPQTSHFEIDLYIGNSKRNWGSTVRSLEWKAMLNGGFIVRCKLIDPGFDLLDTVFSQDYFRTARQNQQPTPVRFRLKWEGKPIQTPWRLALISDMDSRGRNGYSGDFEFIALDPISFHINNGDCSGRVYKGKVGGNSGVIMQVLNDYLPSQVSGTPVIKKVSETTDVPSQYWMMRQDPKTFISSLIDWTSSLTPNKTSWVVANGEDENGISINIEESHTPDLHVPASIPGYGGPLIIRFGGRDPSYDSDILGYEMLHDSFIVAMNSKLLTSGASAISGQYLDRKTDSGEKSVYVKDENTEKKVNPTFGEDRGYTKPGTTTKGWTHIMAIPEFNAGDAGVKYGDYIDGRPRQVYMDMLNMVMRMRVTVRGEARLFDCTDLGRSYITLKWLGVEDDRPKFMDGNWLLYGWHHKCIRTWTTDIYLARLDYNASAIPGQGG